MLFSETHQNFPVPSSSLFSVDIITVISKPLCNSFIKVKFHTLFNMSSGNCTAFEHQLSGARNLLLPKQELLHTVRPWSLLSAATEMTKMQRQQNPTTTANQEKLCLIITFVIFFSLSRDTLESILGALQRKKSHK